MTTARQQPLPALSVEALAAARQVIQQVHHEMPDAVLAILPHAPDVCCRIGFDVAAVPAADTPATGFQRIGAIDATPVLCEASIVPNGPTKVVLGVDGVSGLLMATMQPASHE